MNATLERFMSHTQRDPETGCLLWTATVGLDGYGRFWDGEKLVNAHRWIFVQKHGYAPPVVRHTCDVKACVDWENHLIPGTQADNIQDAIDRGRMPGTGDTCRNGHSDRWGSQVTRSGKVVRRCRECNRIWMQRKRAGL